MRLGALPPTSGSVGNTGEVLLAKSRSDVVAAPGAVSPAACVRDVVTSCATAATADIDGDMAAQISQRRARALLTKVQSVQAQPFGSASSPSLVAAPVGLRSPDSSWSSRFVTLS